MDNFYKVAIIGGGASGLFSCLELVCGENSVNGQDVVILERNDKVGKKLLATGNGQGNITNENIDKTHYFGDKEFIEKFVSLEKNLDFKKYLNSFGIFLTKNENGRYYPVSMQANAILDILRQYLLYKKVNIITDFKVDKILKNKNFEIYSKEKKVLSDYLICAFGGKAGKQFGTDGTSYSLLHDFNHFEKDLKPSLVQLKTEKEKIKGLKGIKERAKLSVINGDKKIASFLGDVLFTDYGISGNTVFSLSSYALEFENSVINVEFLPDFSFEEIEQMLNFRKEKENFLSKEDLLLGILNKRLINLILKYSKSDQVKDIVYCLKNYKLKVLGSLGFDYAQVTKGGIDTKTVDDFSFESKNQKGLYLVGELLNVDGDCGGYNLTFACVSGIYASKDIKNKLKKI